MTEVKVFQQDDVGEAIFSASSFVAHGTKIFYMLPSPGRAALALDTRTMTVTTGPLPRASEQHFCCSGFVVAGDSIYSMGQRNEQSCDFEVLRLGSKSSSSRCWSWSSVPSQPPFEPLYVTCYAVHADGRTIFFSVSGSSYLDPPFARVAGSTGKEADATFSFDTEASKWTLRGYWKLPFHGQAHYDEELDAWVGLHDEYDPKGRVSCCDVLPPATGDESADTRQEAPPWKLAEDSLFRVKGRRHVGGALVYMGGSRFCVVERVVEEKLTREQWKRIDNDIDGPPRLLLHVRTFGLKYGKDGRLCVATCGRRAGCYSLPEGISYQEIFMTLRALWV